MQPFARLSTRLGPALSAPIASFANPSFFLDHTHFRLRLEGIAAWQRLMAEVALPVRQSGCLCWDVQGDALNEQAKELSALGYPLEIMDQAQFRAMEPHVANPPENCLYFPDESAAEAGALADTLLQAAMAAGATVLSGLRVDGFLRRGGSIAGVQTQIGPLEAEQVLVAAGTSTQPLMEKLGVCLPLVERPALVLTTNKIPKLVDHVLVSEIGEVKQCADGALMLPVAVGHQSDVADRIDTAPDLAGDLALQRLQSMFPDVPLSRAGVQLAYRPVPKDGLPVAGATESGLYVAVMHSGITLAAIMSELISEEMLRGPSDRTQKWLDPYRPERFAMPA